MCFPEGPILGNPRRRVLHRFRGQPAAVYAAVDFALQETGSFENPEMLGNRRQRHFERFGQLRNHGFAPRQPGQDGAARGIGERSERGIEHSAGIVNHMV